VSNFPQPVPEVEPSPAAPPPRRFDRWHKRVLSFCLVTFALEIGLFLTVYPWSGAWSLNFLPVRITALLDIWNSPALRAAISAIGLVDMWIALAEFWRLLQPKRPNKN
jgi:hypothetical protein